ncbi:hypothetical protein M9458_055380, partial [Cirrhinus mrigala]
ALVRCVSARGASASASASASAIASAIAIAIAIAIASAIIGISFLSSGNNLILIYNHTDKSRTSFE